MNIFDYFNYRPYLADFYRHRKALNRNFSYRLFARKAGFNSSGLYKALETGKQNLTAALLPKFSKAMDHGQKEAEYFALMVAFTHAKTAAAKQEAFDRMLALLPRKIQRLRQHQADYYREWYYVAVREALSVIDVTEEVQTREIQDLAAFLNPPLKPAQARQALKVLQGLDLVRRNEAGFLKPSSPLISSGPDVDPFVVRRFQKEMMALAAEALERHDRDVRNISTATLSISGGGMERIRRKMDQLREEIMEIARSDEEEDRVYQFNLQFFPLSRTSVSGGTAP